MPPGTPAAVSPMPGSPINRKRKGHFSSSVVLLLIFTNGISFLCGTLHASNAAIGTNIPKRRQLPYQAEVCPPCNCKCAEKKCPEKEECPEQEDKECPELECPPQKDCPMHDSTESRGLSSRNSKSYNPFPELVDRFAAGMAYTTQENFTKTYDLGVPIDRPIKEGDKGVLIIYNTPESIPRRAQKGVDISGGPISAREATENCDQMNVLFTYHEGRRKQCLAIVPQYESFHVQKWLRVPEEGPAMGGEALRLVPRGYDLSGHSAFHPPHLEKHTKKAWKMLETYLDSLDDILDELKPIVNKMAVDHAIVVMVCNFGQSQLLLNFACSARAKGLDTSSVLVFATDQETKDLAEAVGLSVYFDKRNFGGMPKKAARVYGDAIFTNMMLSKVICVHMASMLGVDLLFQDVDVIWFKNPLTYFQKKIVGTPLETFDAYFQDDGQHSTRFAPYGANSGFYYFRSNDKTRYFMTSLLMQSDLVLRSFSHQSAMISVLAEHSSLLGLKVKVLDPFDFPAGFIYHRKKGRGAYGNFFVDFLDGKIDPYIFHMSWTENAGKKILFYRQMDQWYLKDQCIDTALEDIPGLEPGDGKFVENCCSAESIFSCHFSDKPSTRPCKDSPMLDEKSTTSYW